MTKSSAMSEEDINKHFSIPDDLDNIWKFKL